MASVESLIEDVESLQNMLVARATGSYPAESDYAEIRERLLYDPVVAPRLPRFVKTCRSIGQFWAYIQKQDTGYQGRREHIWAKFNPLLEYLEQGARAPADDDVAATLDSLDPKGISALWRRALARRSADPEGAITAARSLLESVCKLILDEMQVPYPDTADLPQLYNLAASQLNLAPAQHSEDVFKRILGGCKTVVDGLAAVRNRFGDAHGKGKQPVRPAPRHAELAVNLAGAMASFLAATWAGRKSTDGQRFDGMMSG